MKPFLCIAFICVGTAHAQELSSFSRIGALVSDQAGNTYVSLPFEHRVIKVSATGSLETIAGTGLAGFSGDGWVARQASLHFPTGLALDGRGNLYVSDTANARIRRIDLSAGMIDSVAGTGQTGFNGDELRASEANLSRPIGLAIDQRGDLLIADLASRRVRLLRLGGGVLSTQAVGSDPYGVAVDPIDGSVVVAELSRSSVWGDGVDGGESCTRGGVCIDADGRLLVLDLATGQALSLVRAPEFAIRPVPAIVAPTLAQKLSWAVEALEPPGTANNPIRTRIVSSSPIDCAASELFEVCEILSKYENKKPVRVVFEVRTPTPIAGIRGAASIETQEFILQSVDFQTLNGAGTPQMISPLPKVIGNLPQRQPAVLSLDYAFEPTVLRYKVHLRGTRRLCVNGSCGPATPFNGVVVVEP